jgi:hypothetical protein
MVRRAFGTGVLAKAAVLSVLAIGAAAAEQTAVGVAAKATRIELFQPAYPAATLLSLRNAGLSQPRLRLEFEGARAQARDWLHDAGFSLLEDRDSVGGRRYQLISGALVADLPALQLRARLGRPLLAAGVPVRRSVPAIGVTMPWREYSFEMEGHGAKNPGYRFMATVYRSDRRVQYGIALPVALGSPLSMGLLLQLRVQFGP